MVKNKGRKNYADRLTPSLMKLSGIDHIQVPDPPNGVSVKFKVEKEGTLVKVQVRIID